MPRIEPRPQKVYDYCTFPIEAVARLFDGIAPLRFPDSYIADEVESRAIHSALALGFRWVRSDGEWAIFEREVEP